MPSKTQIIPSLEQPHTETYINDNTIYTPEKLKEKDGLHSFHVFISDKGRDNQILSFTRKNYWLNEYGTPNFKIHGQSIMNAYNAIDSDEAKIYCMRVMPDDATYANVLFYIKVEIKSGKFFITHHNLSIKISDKKDIESVIKDELIKLNIESTDELFYIPLVFFYSQGRGIYGNNYNVTIQPDFKKRNLNMDYMSFKVKLFDNDTEDEYSMEELSLEEFITGNSISYFIDDVFNDTDKIFSMCFEESIQFLIDKYNNIYNTNMKIRELDIFNGVIDDDNIENDISNIINGVDLSGGDDGNISWFIPTPKPESIEILNDNFTMSAGKNNKFKINSNVKPGVACQYTYLKSSNPDFIIDDDCISTEIPGTTTISVISTIDDSIFKNVIITAIEVPITDILLEDSSIDLYVNDSPEIITPEEDIQPIQPIYIYNETIRNPNRLDNINELYLKAFSGKIDKTIYSTLRVPLDIIMDANYDAITKQALIQLVLTRKDCLGIIDSGCGVRNPKDLISFWSQDYLVNLNTNFIIKESQYYTVKEPFMGKRMNVTTTYNLSKRLPLNCAKNGIYTPCASENCPLDDSIKRSMKPLIDDGDIELKEKLTKLRVNYYEAVGENKYVRGSQTTSQKDISDLSEQNNMHTMLTIKKELEALIRYERYDFSDDQNRHMFTTKAENILSKYKGLWCREATVYFDATEYEDKMSIIHCYLSIIFKSLVKSCIMEIDINQRELTK